MRTTFLGVTLLGLLVLGICDVQAQAYDPYYYGPYWDGSQYQQYLKQHDPYYDLEVMHRKYQAYPIYQPCCFVGVVVVPWSPTPLVPVPPLIIGPLPQTVRRR